MPWLQITQDDWLEKHSPIKNKDNVMVILEQFHIKDNKEWLGSSKINIAINFETKDKSVDVSVGSFTGIKDNQDIPVNNLVVLQPTIIEDYLTVRITAMELDRATTLAESIPGIINRTKRAVSDLPVPDPAKGTITETISLIGGIINLAATMNEDDTIMRKQMSFFVDETRFPETKPGDRYIHVGRYQITAEDGTKVILKFVRPTTSQ